MSTALEDTATGQDGPKERKRLHVPGGTWLSQRPKRCAQRIAACFWQLLLHQRAIGDERDQSSTRFEVSLIPRSQR
ncbi:hypothetical protein NDU88_003189 [Pleurodeles waltl]|uniref:Uncharacterized protein n=1 Tax=Pleurodeles waltl TaxID=8319 RepID=A0AAV7QF12_PLEWA|nr:hypothetical protein NDU88_003189 [Pleurodeles waltl]